MTTTTAAVRTAVCGLGGVDVGFPAGRDVPGAITTK